MDREPTTRLPTPRTKLKIVYITTVVFACIGGYFSFQEYSERKFDHTARMVEFFRANRATLDEVVKMAATEPKILRIDPVSAYPEPLPEQKIEEIRKRLKVLNLSIVEAASSEIRLVGGEYKTLRVGKYIGFYTYGYAYRPVPPKKTFSTLNAITPYDGVGLVPLEGNWYLFGSFEE